MSYQLLDRFVDIYEQIPWNRLPLADRRDVAGGYAMATATVLAAVILVIGGQIPGLAAATTVGPFWFGYVGIPTGGYAVTVSATAILVITPLAFGSGVVVWRVFPSNRSRFGAIAGVLATGLAYLFGVLGSGVVLIVTGLLEDPSSLPTVSELLFGIVYLGVFVFGITFIALFCISIPVGALVGHIHEQAQTAPKSP